MDTKFNINKGNNVGTDSVTGGNNMITREELDKKWESRKDGVATEIHAHSKDACDSDNQPSAVCKYIATHGGTAVFATQHGVAAEWYPFKAAAKKSGLKFVPGIESYFEGNQHLILIAKSDAGKREISRAISENQRQDGMCELSMAALKEHFAPGMPGHGEVIATTACINGPVAAILRTNERVNHEIQKIEKRRDKACGIIVEQARVDAVDAKIEKLENEMAEARTQMNAAKKLAGKSLEKRKKEVEKLAGSELYEAAAAELEADLEKIKAAAVEAETLKEKVASLKGRISAKRKEANELKKLSQKAENYNVRIQEQKALLLSDEEIQAQAEARMQELVAVFGEDLYVEVQYHGIDIEEEIYPKMAEMARKYGVKIVATNDVHTITNEPEELLRRQMLRSLRFEKWEELQPGDDQLYYRTNGEMIDWLCRILPVDVVDEAMDNIQNVVDACDVKFNFDKHYPKFVSEDGRSAVEVFTEIIWNNAKKMFPDGIPEEYQERMKYETETMENMGFIDYHMVVRDFNKYAALYDYIPTEEIVNAPIEINALKRWIAKRGYDTKVGVNNGSGRGSAVGSFDCQMLEITHLDPIRYNLLFERFLNPERITMPDIDSDISRTVRPRVIEYVKEKYGKDCVCGIMTTNAQAPKGAVRIAAKCYGLSLDKEGTNKDAGKKFLGLADKIAKSVPSDVGISFNTILDNQVSLYNSLLSEFAENKDAVEIIKWAKVFEGCFTAYGAHAAGIVITDGTPVKDLVPLRWNDKLGIYTTQCDMIEVEANGMLKFDFLGLKTCDIITTCLWQLHKEGIDIDIYNIPMDDQEVFAEIYSNAQTDSVFQFESSGMKSMLKRFKPTSFEDLIILVSMFRPGPMQYLDDVIDVKNGVKPMTFLTPELEPILGPTYGAITYQEQVMRIFQELAGYSLGGADLVRRAMSKKHLDEIEAERHNFLFGNKERGIKGCIANGIKEDAANALFDQMTAFAAYAFNKSHAAAYAFNSYVTAYLKYHYPAEFLMSAMQWAEKTQKKDPIPGLMAEARNMGVEVCAPSINHSGTGFTVENGKILFGLSAVKSVGSSAEEILAERKANGPFKTLADFYGRTNIKKNAIENLIKAGAFDEFYSNRAAMLAVIEEFKKHGATIEKKRLFLDTARQMLPYIDNLETDSDVKAKQEMLGVKQELKEVTTAAKLQKRIDNAEKAYSEAVAMFEAIEVPMDTFEDKDERMRAERELIGAYVTAHPLDNYPEPSEIGVASIEDINEHTTRIYGLISDVQIKKRKKDGKPMAFITVEDMTGSVQVNVFTESYARNQSMIEVGNVVTINGKAQVETKFGGDDDIGETEIVFVAEIIRPAEKRMDRILIAVSSMAVFHAKHEADFRQKYEATEGGHALLVYDMTMKVIRKMLYKVNDDVLALPGVKVIG